MTSTLENMSSQAFLVLSYARKSQPSPSISCLERIQTFLDASAHPRSARTVAVRSDATAVLAILKPLTPRHEERHRWNAGSSAPWMVKGGPH